MELMQIEGDRIYLDTNIFIYAIEENELYLDLVTKLFERIQQIGAIVVTSELTLAECLVRPYQENDEKSVTNYKSSLQNSPFMEVKPISRSLLIQSAKNRALLKNKLPDAIHVTTAVTSECTLFITNDDRINVPDPLQLLVLKKQL